MASTPAASRSALGQSEAAGVRSTLIAAESEAPRTNHDVTSRSYTATAGPCE